MTFARSPLLFAITASLAQAAPLRHTIQFTGAATPVPTAGSFFYDRVTPLFTDFFVEWNGRTYDLTASANAGGDIAASSCGGGLSGAACACRKCTGRSGPCAPPFWLVGQFVGNSSVYLRRLGRGQFCSVFEAWSIGGEVTVPQNAGDLRLNGGFAITKQDAVPEPTTVALTLLGGLALAAWRRRTRSSQ